MRNWLLGSAIAWVLLGSVGGIGRQPNIVLAQTTEDRKAEGDRLLQQGIQQYTTSQFREAARSWEGALEIYQEIGALSRAGKVLNNLGIVYQSLGEYPKATEFYQQSLAIAREVGDRTEEGKSLGNLGLIYQFLGEYQKAIEYHQQSLAIARDVGNREEEGIVVGNLGIIYWSLGKYQKAIEFYQKSLAIARELGNRAEERKSLNNLGNVYASLGEYQKAIEFYQKSLTIQQEVGDRAGEGNTLNNLGFVYRSLGEYTKAIEYHQRSLTIARDIGDREREGKALNNLGLVYRSLGKYTKAAEYHQQSLTIARNLGNRADEGTFLHNLGIVYGLLREYTKAVEYHQQSLTIARNLGDRGGEGTNLGNLGNIYQSLGDYPKAAEYHQQSLTLLREIGDRAGEGISLENLAFGKHKQGKLAEALQDIQASIAIAESIRAEVDSLDLRQSFFATVSSRYQLYIEILMQLHRENPDRGYDKQAFQASEKNRARTLTELLTEANLDLRQNIDPQLLQQEQRLIQELSTVEKRRLELVSSSYANEDRDRLIRDRDVILTKISDLETRIRRNNPAYADLKYPQALTLPEIQGQILDRETLLLEYALGSDRSYLFVVGKNEFTTYELPAKKEIEAAAEKYAIALQAEDRNPLPEGKDLAKMLLGPIADQLKSQRLAIVADGKLHRLPFGALPWNVQEGASVEEQNTTSASVAPLLVNHEIINLSSASSLAIQRQQSAKRSPAAKKIAIFADPVFSKRDPRLSGEVAIASENPLLELFRDGCQSFDRLPNTRIEAESILSLVPDNQKFLAMGFEADRAAATSKELAQYQILHLSTHGCIQNNPQLSGLALSLYDRDGKPQDGFLRLQDIYNLQLNADLVVLSACQTGIGKEISGEGVVGLTRGFLYAGAQRVTVSLWNVSDRATADLMGEYYRQMFNESISPVAALREAQLQMWRKGEYPYKWAAFTIQGEWQE